MDWVKLPRHILLQEGFPPVLDLGPGFETMEHCDTLAPAKSTCHEVHCGFYPSRMFERFRTRQFS